MKLTFYHELIKKFGKISAYLSYRIPEHKMVLKKTIYSFVFYASNR